MSLVPLTVETSIHLPMRVKIERMMYSHMSSVPCIEYHVALLGEDFTKQQGWHNVTTATDVLAQMTQQPVTKALVDDGILKSVRLLSGWTFEYGNVAVIKTISTREIGGSWAKHTLPFSRVLGCPMHLHDLVNLPCDMNLHFNYATM